MKTNQWTTLITLRLFILVKINLEVLLADFALVGAHELV